MLKTPAVQKDQKKRIIEQDKETSHTPALHVVLQILFERIPTIVRMGQSHTYHYGVECCKTCLNGAIL